MDKINIDLTRMRSENNSLKEDIITLKETINSIKQHLKIVLRVGEFGRTVDSCKLEERFLKRDLEVDRYISELENVTIYLDDSLSKIENPYNGIASEFNQWK